jgi:hypothetical protein
MNLEVTYLPSWLRWEKRRHHALIGLAIVVSAGIASAATNERRMFLLPNQSRAPAALAAIPAPEPTSLRAAIMGYLDGCVPDVTGSARGFDRAMESSDCGRGRRRDRVAPQPPVPAAPEATAPEATPFVAAPEDPVLIDGPLLTFSDLPIEPGDLSTIGGDVDGGPDGAGSPGFSPLRDTSTVPEALEGSVPEPATWALMIGGFGLAGALLRRRREKPAAARA